MNRNSQKHNEDYSHGGKKYYIQNIFAVDKICQKCLKHI